MESLANPKNPISSSAESYPAKGSALSGEGNYAGHSQHCECEKIAKEFERAFADASRKLALTERVIRAAEKHFHKDDSPCYICIHLKELNGKL